MKERYGGDMSRVAKSRSFLHMVYFVAAGTIALAIFIAHAFFAAPHFVHAANECDTTSPAASGYFFTTYDSPQYSSSGYLEYHLRISSSWADGRPFTLSWFPYDDECNGASVAASHISVSLPAGVTDWSIRFASQTHFDVWDDQNNVIISGFDISAYPRYTSLRFSGSVDGGASTFASRTLQIDQSGEAPAFSGTLPLGGVCPPDLQGAVGGSNQYFFDSYEHAEYVNGLLRVHLRLKSPYNDGRPFGSAAFAAGEDCLFSISPPPLLSTAVTPHTRYYSFRMTSPTNWQLWDDETDQPLSCSGCSGNISEDTGYVIWSASIDGGASGVQTTPFSPVEFEPEYEECCSSVVFLPGFKGSTLKAGNDTLWPADLFGADIPQLALNEAGESAHPVVVDGILPSYKITIPGLGAVGPEIYSGFMSFMDTLVTNTEDDIDIREWKALPYDWRFSPEKILADGVQTPTGTMDMIAEIERMAAGSATGQVTIVAHSMGGLMGKAIIKKLEEEGKANLINSFVMVGAPQLGTPQAVASLLHGDGEGIPGKSLVPNFAATRSVVRAAARNFQSAYNLLPSQAYFAEVTDPIFVFDDGASFTEAWRDFWGDSINTYAPFLEFVTGEGSPRTRPTSAAIHVPEVLKTNLMTAAENLHTSYDNYVFPSHIRVVEVAGWGEETTKGIEYKNQHFVQGYKVTGTREGDGVVLYPSALSSANTGRYFFNLFDYNELPDLDAEHGTLLNANPIQALIKLVIDESPINDLDFITESKPFVEEIENQLIVSSYSPVILGVYDSLGNFTGIYPDQDLSADLLYVQENIPGSTFNVSGESQHIFLPKEGIYTFVYQGTGAGPTTIEVASWASDAATPVATYTDIPTTPATAATFVIDASALGNTHIEIDTDNDGETDTYVAPDGGLLTLEELLVNLRTYIEGMDIPEKLKNKLLKKLDRIEKKIANQKDTRASRIIMNLGDTVIKRGERGRISDADVQEILNLLDQIENAL